MGTISNRKRTDQFDLESRHLVVGVRRRSLQRIRQWFGTEWEESSVDRVIGTEATIG